jgi:regulator of sirC expression with transglutaminase-like and TPR domain
MSPAASVRSRLTKFGKQSDQDIELADAALHLAAARRRGIKLEPYHRHLAHLVSDVGRYSRADEEDPDLEIRVEALRQVIASRYGYLGTEEAFDDLDCANLTHVIDRRSGLPVLMSIIYLHVANKLGWAAKGIDFPGRFLVRLEHQGERILIDPYAGGGEVTTPDLRDFIKVFVGNHAELSPALYAEANNREILLRVQNNIKVRQLRDKNLDDALETIEAMLLFAPGESKLWREAGLLYARIDNVKQAVAALEEYMRLDSADSARYSITNLLQELRARLN